MAATRHRAAQLDEALGWVTAEPWQCREPPRLVGYQGAGRHLAGSGSPAALDPEAVVSIARVY